MALEQRKKIALLVVVLLVLSFIIVLVCHQDKEVLTDLDIAQINDVASSFTEETFANIDYTEGFYIKSVEYDENETAFRLDAFKEYPIEEYDYAYLKRNFAAVLVKYYCNYNDKTFMRDGDMAYYLYLIRDTDDKTWRIYNYMTPWDE